MIFLLDALNVYHHYKFKVKKDEKEIIRIRMAVKKLVEANVFRHDKKGRLRFHNRIIEDDIKGAPL